MITNEKTSVSVNCSTDRNGYELPVIIYWNDGRVFPINRTLHTCIETDDEGEQRIRYTVSILGKQRFLYRQGQCWYVIS